MKSFSSFLKEKQCWPGSCVKEDVLEEGRPSQRHPLEGHDYHKKTDAELTYIAKDAHKAAEAMKGHNTQAENKYRDQANDSATVRYWRQKNGMPNWYKKKYGHMKEEVVTEMDKSQPSSSRGAEGLPVGKKADPVKTDKVQKDALKVLQKQYKKVKEDVEFKESDLSRFSKYVMKATKTEPKIVRKTNPAGRTTDHVEYEVHGTLSTHRRSFKTKREAEEYFKTVKEDVDMYSQWSNKEPVEYAKYLTTHFGAPEELTEKRAVWYDKDGFKRIEVLDEYILHASPLPHYDFVYCYVDLKVPHNLANKLAESSESITVDFLKNEVGARCASLTANAVTLNYVLEVVEGRVKPSKEVYESQIKSMKNMFSSGKKYELDWWPDESGDADPKNPYYKESTNEHFNHCGCSINETAAWRRKEGKNPEGGLNRKGIESYRRENPGSKLSMAVTTPPSKLKPGSKAANRRKSFCARMGGMPGPMKDEKGEPTRKALALRKWNC